MIKTFSRAMLKDYLPTNATIIEAGANIGRDSIALHTLFAQATIYAFEPVPHLFEQLQKNVAHIANIHYYQVALSNKNGFATMYVGNEKAQAMSSLLEPHEIILKRPELSFNQIEVPTITIDTWAQKENVKHIDFMWLDMQGTELMTLQASPIIVATVKTILIEVSLSERYKNNPLYVEVHEWFTQNGFSLIIEHLHHGHWGNVLYQRNSVE